MMIMEWKTTLKPLVLQCIFYFTPV